MRRRSLTGMKSRDATRDRHPTRNADNLALAEAAPRGVHFQLLAPEQAVTQPRQGDAALGRLDVLPTLDGVDDGLWALGSLAAHGIRT